MGIKESLNARPQVVVPIAAMLVLIALLAVTASFRGHKRARTISQSFYSDDDGATYFSESLDKDVPFDHNGKPAFCANVFRCHGGAPFVGFLSRPFGSAAAPRKMAFGGGIEVKRPGEAGWSPLGSSKGNDIANVICPSGDRPRARWWPVDEAPAVHLRPGSADVEKRNRDGSARCR